MTKKKTISNWKKKTEEMKTRLQGSRFRWLNEQLYTAEGNSSFEQFQKDPELFTAYHEGYREQVLKWPENPLDRIIDWLKIKPEQWIVGDFGCGEARVSATFPKRKIHSFDLVSQNSRVTACNIANVPLEDASLDVAIFCLSLMGSDWPSFIKEAHRCLRDGAVLYIIEVKSRFTDVEGLMASIRAIGFEDDHSDNTTNSHFAEMRFKRIARGKAEPARIMSQAEKQSKSETRMERVRENRKLKKEQIKERRRAKAAKAAEAAKAAQVEEAPKEAEEVDKAKLELRAFRKKRKAEKKATLKKEKLAKEREERQKLKFERRKERKAIELGHKPAVSEEKSKPKVVKAAAVEDMGGLLNPCIYKRR